MNRPCENPPSPLPVELLHSYPGLALLVDPEDRIFASNAGGATASGRTPEALGGLAGSELFKGAKKRAFRNRLEKARNQGEAELTAPLQTPDGPGPEYELKLVRVGSADSGWVLMVAEDDGPTEATQAPEAEGLSPNLMDALPYGVLVFQGQRLNYANPTAVSLLRLAGVEELQGLMMGSVVYEPDRERMGELLNQAADSGRADGRLRLLGRHDEPLDMEVSIALLGEVTEPTLQLVFHPTTRQRSLERALRESEERYRGLIGSLGEGFWMGDGRGGTADVNQALLDMLGYSREEMLDRPLPDFADTQEAHNLRQHLNKLEEGQPRSFQTRLHHRDGRPVPVAVRMVIMPDPSTGIPALFAFINDLSAHHSLREHLRRETGLNEAILASLPGIFFLAGPDLGLTRWNTNLSQQTGRDALDLAGIRAPDLFAPAERESVRTLLEGASVEADREIEAHLSDAGGGEAPYRLSVAPVTLGEGRFVAALGVDITERKALEADLERMATVDALTGCLTSAAMEQRLTQELERTRRYGNPLSAILIDMDRFQQINDHYGWDTANRVLQDLVVKIEANARAADFLGRWGGDQFLLLAPDTDLEGGKVIAHKLRDLIATEDFDPVVMVHASIGVAAYRTGDTASSLVERVEHALHEARNRGGNQVMAAED